MDNRLDFAAFAAEIVNKVKEYLPRSFENATCELQTVTKGKGLKLTGILIRSADNRVCPNIYLDSFYDEYKSGEDLSSILADIADARIRHEVEDTFDIGMITDFERVKNRIVPKLIGKIEWNTSLLAERPHKTLADLAITYHILLQQDEFAGNASVPITNNLLESWNTDVEELHRLALQNMLVLSPTTFQPMSEVICSMLGEEQSELFIPETPEDKMLFILSNERKISGAANLLDTAMMKKILAELGPIYILSSSVHEVLILKASEDVERAFLNNMICEVNDTKVAVDERLSDHAYLLRNMEEGILSI